MIYDTLENLCNYSEFSQIEDFLKKHEGEILPNGKYVINENCYVVASEYETGEGSLFEAHRKYMDVQILALGREYVYVQNIRQGKIVNEYDSEKDFALYFANEAKPYLLDGTCFLALDAEDLHKPGVSVEQPTAVKKYVFKLRKTKEYSVNKERIL